MLSLLISSKVCLILLIFQDNRLFSYILEELLSPEVELLKELADKLAQASKAGSGLGEFMFDREIDS